MKKLSDKFTTVELIEYLTNIGFMTDFDTEEDTKKLAEIQGRLLELDKIEKNGGKRFYIEPKEEIRDRLKEIELDNLRIRSMKECECSYCKNEFEEGK